MIENFPTKKYSIIYADPPWSYYNDMTVLPRENKSRAGSMTHPNYPVMSSKDIKELPVSSLADDDCILFCWTTDYHLAKCIEVITAWGLCIRQLALHGVKEIKMVLLCVLWELTL